MVAWWNAAGLFFDWALGLGPDWTNYTAGSIQVYQMAQAPGLQGARNFWYQKNQRHIAFENCQNLEPVLSFVSKFGLQGAIEAGGSATQQFVGGYSVDIVPDPEGGTATFTVTNVTSMQSFLYDLAGVPRYSRETFPYPGSDMGQTFTWQEQMCRQEN
jgi:hypothetical protein